MNPVFTSVEPPIPLLATISSPSTITLTATDFLNATVMNHIDRKFILITIPTSTSLIMALVDQHAADERYRLETIIKFLSTSSIHPTDLEIPFPKTHIPILSQRKHNLRQWGIEIQITTDDMVHIKGIPVILAKDNIDGGGWKGIMLSYLMMNAEECPSGLMDMFCSKACRSV